MHVEMNVREDRMGMEIRINDEEMEVMGIKITVTKNNNK